MPYPNHLKENMPMICPNSWVSDQVKEKCGASGRYPREEEDALNIRIGCSNCNNLFVYIIFNFVIHILIVSTSILFYILMSGY
jgi:hypothetical protein